MGLEDADSLKNNSKGQNCPSSSLLLETTIFIFYLSHASISITNNKMQKTDNINN
jgi:hypothetical protein